jgi:hypothetical protein
MDSPKSEYQQQDSLVQENSIETLSHKKNNNNNNDEDDYDNNNNDKSHSSYIRTSQPRPVFQIPSNLDERRHVHDTQGEESWQARVLHILHGTPVTLGLMLLLLLDVIILFVELHLSAEYPECRWVERDAISCCPMDENENQLRRFMESSSEEESMLSCASGYTPLMDVAATCDPHRYPAIHVIHNVLRGMTLFILSTFLLELVVLLVVCGPRNFCGNFFYCLDLFVVTASLVFELIYMAFHDSNMELVVALLLMGRLWRFVRIGHGIFEATYELSKEAEHAHSEYTRKLEELCRDHGLDLPIMA